MHNSIEISRFEHYSRRNERGLTLFRVLRIARQYASVLLRLRVNQMLIDSLINSVKRTPSAPAVTDGTRSLNYRQLADLASVFRGIIERASGCERIGIMLPASTAFPAVLMGVLWAKRTAVPLNFLLSEDELKAIITDAELDLVITVRHFSECMSCQPCRTIFLEDLPLKRKMVFERFRARRKAPNVNPMDTAVILYTSGTTAQPKGVELTYRNLHSNCTDTIAALDIDSSHRFLNILPPFHVFGLTGTVLVPIVLGASSFAIPRFNPLAVVRAIRDYRISLMMAVPSMYAAMLRTKSTTADDFQSVILAVSGGEPLPDSVRKEFEERFRVVLRQGYGLTETSPVVAAGSVAHHKTGTVGKPIRHVEVRTVDENGESLHAGGEGEILVRGPGLMKGYYKKTAETEDAIDSEGWFHTGDIGCVDSDGYLAITGRAKEMLIIGGENVFPREIEAALEAHDDVLQAAVIGVPDTLRGEVPIAYVLCRPDSNPDGQDLRNFVKGSIAGFKIPKEIIVKSDLPVGPTGKLLKRQLHTHV